jgi:hypothetical protein
LPTGFSAGVQQRLVTGLAVFGLQQEDPRWWRWMQVVGQIPQASPDTTGPAAAE